MLLAIEDKKGADGVKSLHEQINEVLIGEFGRGTQTRTDERGLRMPSWWNERDSEGVTIEAAQAMALGMRTPR